MGFKVATGEGFVGNYQEMRHLSRKTPYGFYNSNYIIPAYDYDLSFKHRSNIGVGVQIYDEGTYDFETIIPFTPANEGTPSLIVVNFTSNISGYLMFTIPIGINILLTGYYRYPDINQYITFNLVNWGGIYGTLSYGVVYELSSGGGLTWWGALTSISNGEATFKCADCHLMYVGTPISNDTTVTYTSSISCEGAYIQIDEVNLVEG